MNFDVSEDQAALIRTIDRFAADRGDAIRLVEARHGERGRTGDNARLLAELGLPALFVPEDDGGFGGGPVDAMVVMRALGQGLVLSSMIEAVMIPLAVRAALRSAWPAGWSEAITMGSFPIALAFAEHGRGFGVDILSTRAERGRLSGRKTFVPAGAESWIVTASDEQNGGLYRVDPNAPGVTARRYRLIDGSFACDVALDDVEAERIGDLDRLDAALATARISICAEMVGIMQRLLDETLDYVRQRHQFGVSIGSFQVIQHRLADQYVALELAQSHLLRAALASDDARPAAIAAAKSFIAGRAVKLAEECVQFHGGMGVTDELLIGHGLKRILLLASYLGDAPHELRRYLHQTALADA